MKLEISYADILSKYPVLVEEMIAKLRRGKSKHKEAKPEELKWWFDWCVKIEGVMSFGEMLMDAANPPPRQTTQQRLDETLANTSVCLMASIGKWTGYTEPLPTVPEEVSASYKVLYEKDEAEYQKFQSLSKEEQDKEVGGLLKQLRGSGLMM